MKKETQVTEISVKEGCQNTFRNLGIFGNFICASYGHFRNYELFSIDELPYLV